MSRRLTTLTVLAAALPALATAETLRHGRIRHVEDGVTIQRSSEAAAEEAEANLPFLPGDRVWTDHHGRAEFQFEGGSLLRLDAGSKLDYLNHEDERIVLRFWSGSLYLDIRDRRASEFEIETPGGLVATRTRGVYRIDTESGETRLSVFEGEAVLEGSREVRVSAGERAVARGGEIEDGPSSFDLTEGDRFADWVQDRQQRTTFAGERPAYLPEEVSTYADEFDAHGSWYYEAEVGHVWRPYVASGWRPYWDGRWVWTAYGWTWVPRETWGWAAFHYGRWGYSPAIGWYWIPGRQWGPAWVTWGVGRDRVGWCPLGYRDRPVIIRDRGSRARGNAVPRGTTRADAGRDAAAFVFANRSDFASGRAVPRLERADATSTSDFQLVDGSRARLGKDLSVVDGPWTAAPRASRKPTMGDYTPELRPQDPGRSIPFTAARRRGRATGERFDNHSFGEAAVEPSKRTTPEAADAPAHAAPRGGWQPAGGDGSSSAPRTAQPAHRDRGESTPFTAAPRRSREEGEAKQHEEREVLRPIFGGLSRPRDGDSNDRGNDRAKGSSPGWEQGGRGRGEDRGSRPRDDDGGARRVEPARGGERQRSAPEAKSEPRGERKRSKDKEHH
jgi:hypothetical protein